ncbi:hypothetical protein Goklo_000638, partial [Gossypium klotzschianum]|nr:hypothetical protein [Gossypium klotzschianum]
VDDSIDNKTRGNSARLASSIDLRQPLILNIHTYPNTSREKEKNNEDKILFFKQPSMMELNHRAEEEAFGPEIEANILEGILDTNIIPNVSQPVFNVGKGTRLGLKLDKKKGKGLAYKAKDCLSLMRIEILMLLRSLSESISVVSDKVETQHKKAVDVETPYNIGLQVALLLHGFLQVIGMQLSSEYYRRATDGSTKNGDMFPSLTEIDHGRLSTKINIAKVKEALDTIAPLKASGQRNCSYVWRSLSTVWMDLRRSVFWQLGDDRNTKFWTDIWISELGPLIDSFIVGELAFEEASMYDMTTITREWNWDCFENELPQNFLSCIASI